MWSNCKLLNLLTIISFEINVNCFIWRNTRVIIGARKRLNSKDMHKSWQEERLPHIALLYSWLKCIILCTQVSFKFRDPLSAIGMNELLLPLRRVITEHEDVSAYVQRAGGLNKAILAVLSEENFLRYSEGHVSTWIQSRTHRYLWEKRCVFRSLPTFPHFYWTGLPLQLLMSMEIHPYILQPRELSHSVQRNFSSGGLMLIRKMIILRHHLSYHSLLDYYWRTTREWQTLANLLPWLPLRWDHQSICHKIIHVDDFDDN